MTGNDGSKRPWRPSLGAWLEDDRTHFRLWARHAERVQVEVQHRDARQESYPLQAVGDGYFAAALAEVAAGDRYRFRLDDGPPLPDPASRYQPDGPHAASQVVDASRFHWTDDHWPGIDPQTLVIYELHVGTFSPRGNYDGVIQQLQYLADLGVGAIELMPLAECDGARNWGYDGVDLFAPSHHYGHPDELRRLVDLAHTLGLGVILDVVYNHFGPAGNYLPKFSSRYFSKQHQTVWGKGLNFDGRDSRPVREFFIENALHWIHEYHIDGLRLDATHGIVDESRRHFLAELSGRIRRCAPPHGVLLVAEDHRNLKRMMIPEERGGLGLDGVWADDFHHQLRRRLAGDQEGYFGDFSGSIGDLAETIRRGWFYCGQHSRHWDEPRGSDPQGLPLRCFVHCLQNHDQVGNRALGQRLHHQISPAAYRAASAVLLAGAATPLLFMGQEWAASTAFLYFTDHEPALGRRVTQGRRQEFKAFSEFSDPVQRKAIPDPQHEQTYLASCLKWDEIDQGEHAATLQLYRRLLALRRGEPTLTCGAISPAADDPQGDPAHLVKPLGEAAIAIGRRCLDGTIVMIVAYLPDHQTAPQRFGQTVQLAGLLDSGLPYRWEVLVNTEDPAFSLDPKPPEIELGDDAPTIRFSAPAAVILKGQPR